MEPGNLGLNKILVPEYLESREFAHDDDAVATEAIDHISDRAGCRVGGGRERLRSSGWTIITNIGDQDSVLTGGFAERTFKLPNPAYLVK